MTDDSLFLMRPMGCPSARLPRMPPAGYRVFEVGERSEVGALESLTFCISSVWKNLSFARMLLVRHRVFEVGLPKAMSVPSNSSLQNKDCSEEQSNSEI